MKRLTELLDFARFSLGAESTIVRIDVAITPGTVGAVELRLSW